ncbi:hypothetical protein A3A46_03415 [Candidatus Roizmanbacteria bacterium RIFCSPLOWO2_01_FULL_37_13]|uniref:DUF2933 domain-containing protein n=1 Tax=Candidatus Roizmanbacteria bacterium RIFCSPHIGHO2_02_FULL_38_11 TaxID=1802039 RepID=A0A1F7GX99_9BACT|nr:MAG: hypothetical protein A3C25_02250 [Candidatus Roizmanbacteria bacterium RIFCSPHIGHO2_02_FULL_38_11]OGK43176.1 MAG: hypothetical protein A3A46_03415 [Candidatus Roizmanbacteria bacterium RIFCSPLOWO2_01_FULL_37_13]
MKNLLAICLIGVSVAATAIFIFKLPVNSVLFYGFLLVCPLMHIFMMRGEHDKNSKHSHH